MRRVLSVLFLTPKITLGGRYSQDCHIYLGKLSFKEVKCVFDQDNLNFQAKQYFPTFLSPTLLLRTLSVHPLCSQPRGAS